MDQNLPTCVNPFQEVGSTWVDGEHGRRLRQLWDTNEYGETIAADLMAVVSATHIFLSGRGLQLSGGKMIIFHALVDFVIARLENPYETLGWSAGDTTKPKGWNERDEHVWQEWLDTYVLSPENWNRHIMEPVFGRREGRVWEESAGRWRNEWRTYVQYFVTRSRDILQEIDPRPWDESSDGWGSLGAASGEEEWRR